MRKSTRNCPVSSAQRHVFPASLAIQELGRLARLHRPTTWTLRKSETNNRKTDDKVPDAAGKPHLNLISFVCTRVSWDL